MKTNGVAKFANDQLMIVNKQLEAAMQCVNGNEEARFFIDSALKSNKAFVDFLVKQYGDK